ncbi:MAG: SGNH/GDSL hydrolase family protein, partial [Kiritimatiellae bacterium]|nr:SGNH/GDSL hydrolase family protein [Kiritimatiellia bacterium]
LLMTWNEGALEADAAALASVFDESSANGANPKIWAENLVGGGGRLWLDLDYGAERRRVNILCVGDSITHGNDGNELCGTGKNGGWGNWRTGLMKKLAAAGYEPVAKGHRWDQSHDICGATMPDDWVSHAGAGGGRLWRGTIDQIENTLDQAGDLDFVLCKIGTNDMGAMQPAALFEVWTNLVWKVLRQKTSAKFIAGAVVDIAYNPTLNNRVVTYNSLVRNAIESGTFPAKRAYFADLYTA